MAETSNAAKAAVPEGLFQASAEIPKEEVGALRLLKKYPDYDGRGAVVAIFDTGVDPAAAGLAVTSDGKPKVVDLQDCTGCGDVAMGPLTECAAEDGVTLVATTGKKLKVSPAWSNPTGKWRVGSKSLFELYPPELLKRVTQKRKEGWKKGQDAAVAEAISAAAAVKDSTSDAAKELQVHVKLLEEHAEKYTDVGTLVHCVVWHDGDCYRAALDTSELEGEDSTEGKLADFIPMTDFRAERQFAAFSALDACNYAVNIYDGGATLSIVTDTSPHGTHVAGIVAACMRNEDGSAAAGGLAPFEGVAPGAQIVSCKIGDNRVKGMETGPGLARALTSVVENKVDVINMSFGESTSTADKGRFVDLAREIVRDHGVIFISSAGNAGPGLSTVGAPGGTCSDIIGIGAYVSPSSAAAVHSHDDSSLPEGWAGQQYNWSSRGPAPDGHLGVDICSMGGAIAPVPQWCQQRRQLMNGTSMSSPCAAGAVALLVSALKQLGQPVTPARVRRAVENTAGPVHKCPEDKLAYGHGLIQVDAALEYLIKSERLDVPDRRILATVRATEGIAGGGGIYLRDAVSTSAPTGFTVNFTPLLHRDADVREDKLAVEEQLELVSTADWVSAPKALLLPHNGRVIDIKVDPTGLPPGLHYAELQAVEAGHPWRGPAARVPITVCKPLPAEDGTTFGVSSGLAVNLPPMAFEPGAEHRHYLVPPTGASWAEVTLHAGEHDTPKVFMVHTTQLLPHKRPTQSRQSLSLAANAEATVCFPVTSGVGLEVAVAQFWKAEGSSEITASVAFHGITPSSMADSRTPGHEACTNMVHAPLRLTKINPKATLSSLAIPLRPTEHVITSLTEPRDALLRGRVMHRMLLTYKLTLAEAGAITPAVPPLDAQVYDGTMEGQLYGVYDSNKKMLSFGDVYPASVSVGKGDYTIKLALRHESVAVLTSLKNVTMLVHKKLEAPITVPCHASLHAALTKAKPMAKSSLRRGDRVPLFLGPVPEDSLPKDAKAGCTLTGSLKLAHSSPLAGDRHAPCGCPLAFTVPPAAKKDPEDSDKDDVPEEKGPLAKMRKAQVDAQVKVLKDAKLVGEDDWDVYHTLSAELAAAYPENLAVPVDALKRAGSRIPDPLTDPPPAAPQEEADAEAAEATSGSSKKGPLKPEDVRKHCDAALVAAEEVLKRIDQVAVAQFIAFKNKPETVAEKKHRAHMKEQRGGLVEALNVKCRALGAVYHLEQQPQAPPEGSEAVAQLPTQKADAAEQPEAWTKYEASYKELSKWVDVTAADYVTTYSMFESASGRPANAIKALNKVLSDKDKLAPKAVWLQQARMLRAVGWTHWAQRLDEQFNLAFPKDFASL